MKDFFELRESHKILDESKGTGVKKFVRGMRVQNLNGGSKGTVIKGGDNLKKAVEVEWDNGQTTLASAKYLKSIKKNESVGLGEAKDDAEYNDEGGMAISQLKTAKSAVEELMSIIKDNDNLPEWVQSKLTKAVDYMDSVRDYMSSEKSNVQEARKDASADLYFDTYSAAVQHAKAQAEKKGFEVVEDDWFRQVNTGKGKPSGGKTTRHTLKLTKNGKPVRQGLAIQVYNRDTPKNTYELNFYVS